MAQSRRRIYWFLFILFVVLTIGFLGGKKHFYPEDRLAERENKDQRPNIVLIMADDLGYSDLGCYGGEISTPNLDRLAQNGLRFTSFYNAGRCCPTRASMLTGLYSHQAGIGRMTIDQGLEGYQGTLDDNTATIAELMRAAGYQTGMVGKWHVSITNRRNPKLKPAEDEEQLKWLAHQADFGPFSDTSTYPLAKGFDRYFGNIWGVVDYFDPFSLVNGMETIEKVPEGFYYTKVLGDSAAAYVDTFHRADSPFFLYVAHCAPHWPLQAPEATIKKYENRYRDGWRALREERYERMLTLGLFDSTTAPLTPFMFPELDWKNHKDTIWDARAMAVHAAMVEELDESIGILMNQLRLTGELDNTFILFISDNGASAERPSKYGPGFDRAGSTRSGETVYFPVDKSADHLPGPQTVHSGIGPNWAHVVNTPFRYWKARVFEGGINSPCIIHWPQGLMEKGAIRRQAAHIVDLMPTFLDLAESVYPSQFNGVDLKPIPGQSMIPLIKNTSAGDTQETYFWEHFGAAAIRKGAWKLVRLRKGEDWELYNMQTDRTEQNDLSNQYPEKVNDLAKEWEALAHRYQAIPAPN